MLHSLRDVRNEMHCTMVTREERLLTWRAYDIDNPARPPVILGVTTANIAAANTIMLPRSSSLNPNHL